MGDSRCINQYLLGKSNTTYDALKGSLREKSRAPLNTLESMTFFKCDRDIIEILLNLLAATEDRKTTRIIHYFLTEISQYKFTNVAETKLINTTFTKEVQHKDLSRRIAALKNYVLLAPSDSFVDANLKELVIGFLRKTGEDKKEGKEKEKKKLFSRGTDASRERCMIQYGALVACRHRFAKPQQALFVPVIDALRSDDPNAARHAAFLTLEFTREAGGPSNVAANIQRFLPHLKAKEAAYVLDPLARVYFANICTLIGLKADNNDNDFFQALVQTVLDTNTRVAFEGMASLALFPWSRLEKATLQPTQPPAIPDIPPLWEPNANPTPLFSAVVKRLTSSLSLNSPNSSSPLVHAACRTVKILAEAFSNHLSDQELNAPPPVFKRAAAPTSSPSSSAISISSAAAAAGSTSSTSASSSPSSSSASSSPSPALPPSSPLSSSSSSSSLAGGGGGGGGGMQKEVSDRLLSLSDKQLDHPLASLYPHVVALLEAPSNHVRFLALKTLVWLVLPNSEDTVRFRHIIMAQLVQGILDAEIVEGVFTELLRRVQSVPRFSGLALTLVADWCWLAAEKVNFSIVYSIWKTIIEFGPKGRALVLTNIFYILDRDLVPQQRTLNILIKKNIFWFLGENGNVLVNDTQAHYSGSASADITNPGLKAIVIRLSQGALLGAWEVRSVCTEALAKIAILSHSKTRIHIYGVATRLLHAGASTCVETNASMLVSLLDQLLEGRRKWLPTFKENPVTLDAAQLESLYTTHTHLVAQCSVVCVVPRDFCPLGPECQRYLNSYAGKSRV